MGNICPEEEVDDDTLELFLKACEEDEDTNTATSQTRQNTGEH
jgi:hypothetical protein